MPTHSVFAETFVSQASTAHRMSVAAPWASVGKPAPLEFLVGRRFSKQSAQ